MDKYKLCPYLPQKEEIKAITMGTGDCVVTYFKPCLGEECAAYLFGKCMYGGANIDVIKENKNEESK